MRLATAVFGVVVLVATGVASGLVRDRATVSPPETVSAPVQGGTEAEGTGNFSQGVYFMKEVIQYDFLGEWTQASKQGLIHWQPVGAGTHTLKLVYEDKSVSLPIAHSGEVLQHSSAFIVDFKAGGRFQFDEMDASESTQQAATFLCDGSYSMVRSVGIVGECWDAGTIDPATGCTRWKCNQNNSEECKATIVFTDGSPDKELEWTCSNAQDRKITSCPGGQGGTASVSNANSGC